MLAPRAEHGGCVPTRAVTPFGISRKCKTNLANNVDNTPLWVRQRTDAAARSAYRAVLQVHHF